MSKGRLSLPGRAITSISQDLVRVVQTLKVYEIEMHPIPSLSFCFLWSSSLLHFFCWVDLHHFHSQCMTERTMTWFFITYRSEEKKWLKSTEGKLNPILREKENFTLKSSKTCSHIFLHTMQERIFSLSPLYRGSEVLVIPLYIWRNQTVQEWEGLGEGMRKWKRCYLRLHCKKGQSWGWNRPVWLHTTAVLILIMLPVALCQVLTSWLPP